MFLVGETTGKVDNGKLSLPKEYHLKRREIFGKWKGVDLLYLSDSMNSLDYMAGRESLCFKIKIDSEGRIELPNEYNQMMVYIKGCITTLELKFNDKIQNAG